MKKIALIFIITTLILSCSDDFLERIPTTSTVIESYYSTPEDGTEALTAVYNMLLIDDWWSPIIYSELASDNCAGGAGSGDGGGFQRVDRFIQQPTADANGETWSYYYGGIARANIYIENEALIDWSGHEAQRSQYQAEARFLRAYFHFVLTRMFGEIPALDHVIADELLPRTPAEELFGFMLDDLVFCIENGLSVPYASITEANWGRANKWAAEAMFARVYLYYSGYYNDETVGDYSASDALTYIEDVINNSGHDLVEPFASLWRVPTYSELGDDSLITAYAGEINPEVVWSIRYVGGQTGFGSSNWERMIGPRNTNLDPYGQGWGAMTVLPAFWNAYDDGDSRKTASILSWDDEGYTYDWVTNGQAQYTGYSCKKYEIASINSTPEPRPDWQTDAFEDYMVIRFADVLLMAAELQLNAGNSGAALGYVNQVRERAFGDNSHNYSSLTIDDIFQERKLELAFEGIRYWDILRSCKGDFSKLVDILTYVDEDDGGDYSQSANTSSLDVDGNNFVVTKGLFQIPQDELDLMEGIIQQNPGYE